MINGLIFPVFTVATIATHYIDNAELEVCDIDHKLYF